MTVGRNTKLTTELTDKICEALRAGNYIETACEFAGIVPATYYRWIADSEKPDAGVLLVEFREAVKKARATAEVRNVALIQQAAQDPNKWQASAWWLERQCREDFAPPTSKTHIEGDMEIVIRDLRNTAPKAIKE